MSALPTLFAENDASLPVQERLVRTVRDAILAGHLPQGSRLPPSRVLARDLSLSRGTVEQAYGRLEAEGYLTRRVGDPRQRRLSGGDGHPAQFCQRSG